MPRPRRFSGLIANLSFSAAAMLLLGAGCIPGESTASARQSSLLQLGRPSVVNESLPLRGKSEFDADSLTPAALEQYRALQESIALPEQQEYIESLAASRNIYEYGRLVQTHIGALLTAFRLTGDLALLDRVDELTQLMRGQLDDSWKGVREGRVRDGKDGYLNWIWDNRTSDSHRGKDLHETDEIRAHALIAEVAWAFRSNRDLSSPAGVDYGERSEFWEGYLEDHFEAKWRERNRVAWPRFPFLQRPYVHPTLASTKYHFYMFKLTGRQQYLTEAVRLSDLLFGEFHEVETAAGPALVWRRSIIAQGGDENYLMPTDYSSLVIVDALSLHFAGFYGWADPRLPTGLANTVSQFVIDNGAVDFARDIGGGERRAGIRPSSAAQWQRVTPTEFSINSFALLAPWDSTGTIADVSRSIFAELPAQHRYPFIPTGLLAAELIGLPENSSSE